jgi:hypothetical protein
VCSQEGPLYKLRAKLVFSPVHASVRHLAQAVDAFVRQGESVLHSSTQGCNANYNNRLLAKVCDSPNEAALALQALPLLHLAGFSTFFDSLMQDIIISYCNNCVGIAAPRAKLLLGHAPVALNILLSEVFMCMCPPSEVASKLSTTNERFQNAEIEPIVLEEDNHSQDAVQAVEEESAQLMTEEDDDDTVEEFDLSSVSAPKQPSKNKHTRRRKHKSSSDAALPYSRGKPYNEYEDKIKGSKRSSSGNHSSSGHHDMTKRSNKLIVLGVVSGSLDTTVGRVTTGLIQDLKQYQDQQLEKSVTITTVAMCFPTPRDPLTDLAATVFDYHINLSPHNKTDAINRILDSEVHLAIHYIILTSVI